MHRISKKTLYIIVILGLSLITRFAFFGYPNSTVFDEVHFGKFVDGYYTGEYYFDIHPPLGKLLIAGFSKIGGYQAGDFEFDNIGEGFDSPIHKYMRFFPSLAGALLPVVLFLLALQFGMSKNGAALVGMLAIFENALIAQSRFILMDSFLLLFGFLGIYFYTKKNFLLAGIFAIMAGSIKWTGLSFLGIIGLLYLFALMNEKNKWRFIKDGFIYLIAIPFILYFSIFAIHFSLLPDPGPGDGFMSQEFRDGKLGLFSKFTELNKAMYAANKGLTATHPFSSKWYQWPLNQKPIYYWNGVGDLRIYLLGNPLVWFLGFASILLMLVSKKKDGVQKFLIFAFLINWLPFIFIGRVMFLYHYFPALVFSILGLGYVLDKKLGKKSFVVITMTNLAFFLILSPLTYGFKPLPLLLPIIEFFL